MLLFALAALAEIGGAWLVWQGVREHRGWVWIGAGVIALGLYGFVATLQPDANFGRILAAYGGVFVAGSLRLGDGRRRLPPRPLGRRRRRCSVSSGWPSSCMRHARAEPTTVPRTLPLDGAADRGGIMGATEVVTMQSRARH